MIRADHPLVAGGEGASSRREGGGPRERLRSEGRGGEITVIGVSHHTAPVEIRERAAFDRDEAERSLAHLRESVGVEESVLLSTCNRTELYVISGDREAETMQAVERVLAGRSGEDLESFRGYLFRLRGEEAVRHLFEVTAGLDSLVVGEAEIQGQVRDAIEAAANPSRGEPVAGPVLHRLFEMALAVGGRVRSETPVGEGTASVASVSVELARKIFGNLRDRKVLILGAGSTAELAGRALRREGVRGAIVANRTLEKAERLAAEISGEAIGLDAISEHLPLVDMVVASTSAPNPILTRRHVECAARLRGNRPLLLIDIAMPRDIEVEVGDLPNLFLYNLDDLREIVDQHLERRRGAIPAAQGLIGAQEEEFRRWQRSRERLPLIRELRSRAELLREEETERILRRMDHLDPEDLARVEAFSRRLMNRLLHEPTILLREESDGDRVEMVRQAFGLDGSGPNEDDYPRDEGER